MRLALAATKMRRPSDVAGTKSAETLARVAGRIPVQRVANGFGVAERTPVSYESFANSFVPTN
jgi:hypothetical protein